MKDGEIIIYTTTRKRLERFYEVRIVHETKGFGLDFVTKTDIEFWSPTPGEQYSKEGRFGTCI